MLVSILLASKKRVFCPTGLKFSNFKPIAYIMFHTLLEW